MLHFSINVVYDENLHKGFINSFRKFKINAEIINIIKLFEMKYKNKIQLNSMASFNIEADDADDVFIDDVAFEISQLKGVVHVDLREYSYA